MIVAFKKDQITTYLVMMEIYTEREVFSIYEETPSCMKFMDEMAKRK